MMDKDAEGDNLLEYWHMCGAEGYNFRHRQANRSLFERDIEWEEEENRRFEADLPIEELLLLDRMKREKEDGVLWGCPKCKAEYRIKTPFHRLYCSKCLGPLRCRRYLPKGHNKPGYWIFEDDRQG